MSSQTWRHSHWRRTNPSPSMATTIRLCLVCRWRPRDKGNRVIGRTRTSVITDYATAAEQLKAGTLRALATASARRVELVRAGIHPEWHLVATRWGDAAVKSPPHLVHA